MHTQSYTTCQHCAELERRVQALRWNDNLGMLNAAGLQDAIDRLPAGSYVIVFADVDRLKAINSATGSHAQTNRYLRDGLRVRAGEIAGQLYGDEIVFILAGGADARGFIARISRQLAEQPLTPSERAALAPYGAAHLSATFAWAAVDRADIVGAIEACSIEVLAKKGARAC